VLRLTEGPVPEVPDGAYLVRNLYLSLDPTNRIWMTDMDQYLPPVPLGGVMRGGTIGRVVESRAPAVPAGTIVQGLGGWQDYWLARPGEASKLPADPSVPLTMYMGLLGATGATAYFGMLDIGKPKAGDNVVVSAAGGAVGSVAGQIAKIQGARVIGIAGGAEKCEWITRELGFDAAIDYKNENVLERLKALAPGGVNVYFDNTGGPILDAVLQHLAIGARIPLCGLIASYNDARGLSGPRFYHNILMKRAMVQGFIILDYAPRFGEAFAKLGAWHREGRIQYRVDVYPGLEHAPETLKKLFDGSNRGKLIVKIADE
ncbi:MAG TPA: NADP-dependent oxidoreductase, partial [Steroidobacteraceae bacterium]|nr:NADP-dependent oxidoreductase [Steroidobacteraceae bacterium]